MTTYRSDCPIASALTLFGDKWTLLIIRDILFGRHKFSEFVESAEGIKRNILTDRLQKLQEAGLVERRQYQDRPARYEYRLTRRGADLLPVIQEIAKWGAANIDHTYDPPDVLLDWLPEEVFARQ